ncbi:MAG: protein-L-isoaspartate(D-aspartate) O-methyltransferase [Pseudomonadota bacterium]
MSEEADAVARAALAMHLRAMNAASRPVLAALESVPRALFIDKAHRDLAYEDRAVPIACGQTVSQPTVVAMMTEALGLTPDSAVLEIGTGSGYQCAVLSRLAREVTSVERYRHLSALAAERLTVLGATNVRFVVGDGNDGVDEHAPYDAIIVTAATPAVPQALVDQLVKGGRIVAPIGPTDGVQDLMVCTKDAGELAGHVLAPVRFVPLLPGVAEAL